MARTLGRRGIFLSFYLVLLGGTAYLFNQVPAGFIPTQDKLYLFSGAQLPGGASLSRTAEVARQMSDAARSTEGVELVSDYIGFNALQTVNTPNVSASYVVLKPFNERTRSATEITAELNEKFAKIKGGYTYALMPPPIQGLGNGSGYSLYLKDRAGLGFAALNAALTRLQAEIAATPGMSYPVTSYQANIPQLEVVVDRVKAKVQGVSVKDIFETLQTYLGAVYVNDFNKFGRVYRVMVQADAAYRQKVSDIENLQVRNSQGAMVPISSVVRIEQSFGPDPVIRYNGYPAADLIGGTDATVMSSSQAIDKITEIAEKVLPAGIELEWTDLSYQEVTQSNSAIIVFPVAILLVFVTLAVLYESWILPFSVILIVPASIFSALLGVWLTGGDNNIFVQVGLVVLIGLACKNAILIVEFARELEMQGRETLEATTEACRLRLRPIIMTSIAFIAGSVPLLLGQGAGGEIRLATGVTVFAGMLGVTLFGLFLTPIFYVAIRKLSGESIARPAEDGVALYPLHR
ncbi:Efflux pump membrane transporter BepE [compost metagenome]